MFLKELTCGPVGYSNCVNNEVYYCHEDEHFYHCLCSTPNGCQTMGDPPNDSANCI